MATSEDKRLITIGTHPSSPIRLMISNSPTPWRLLRRAWERIEILRETPIVELRENSFMSDDRATDVVIVHEWKTTRDAPQYQENPRSSIWLSADYRHDEV
jgi:hypothetical protein